MTIAYQISDWWEQHHITTKIIFAWIVAYFPTDMLDYIQNIDPNPHVVEWFKLTLVAVTITNVIYNMIKSMFGKRKDDK
jgi:hypothetical protein